LIKWFAKTLLIAAIFIPVATALPLAAFHLCRTADGATVFFFIAPWSCCFWVLLYSQLSASKFWLGAEHVRQWREEHGGLLHTSLWACGWMFGSLFFSYVAEFLLVFLVRGASGRALLPFFTYLPLAFCWAWRRIRWAR